MRVKRRARNAARRLYRACLVDGMLDEGRTRQAVARLAGAGRRGGLAILVHFHRLVRLECARHAAVVESAVPLPEDVRRGVERGVARRYGPGVRTSFAENPALIGGMRVRVGSDVYDGSVRSALAALEKAFSAASGEGPA